MWYFFLKFVGMKGNNRIIYNKNGKYLLYKCKFSEI